MGTAVTVSRFAKCGGDLHHLSRRFHSLPVERRRIAVCFIEQGLDADKAIKQAKAAKPNTCDFCDTEIPKGESYCIACSTVFSARMGHFGGR